MQTTSLAFARLPKPVDFGAKDGPADLIFLIAAPEGIARLEEALGDLDIPITLVTGAIDEKLDENGFIVPGLGDAGDRLYGVV